MLQVTETRSTPRHEEPEQSAVAADASGQRLQEYCPACFEEHAGTCPELTRTGVA
jgi:hypothetical protein